MMNNCNNTATYVGSEVKFRVTITAYGFSQDTDDWAVTISRGQTSHTYAKADCIHNLDGWFVVFDTTTYGPGVYEATITAYIPDTDFPDGTRKEVRRCKLIEVKP